MKCHVCNKEVSPDDMHDDIRCDDCFDAIMEQEDLDFDVYYNQDQKCFYCDLRMNSWVIKEIDGKLRAIHWPNCNQRQNEHIIPITFNDGKLIEIKKPR